MIHKYRNLERNEFIVIGADTAAGGGDYCAAQFISKTRIDVPWVYHSPSTATEMTNDLVPILEDIYDMTGVKPVIAYERNNGGTFEIDRLAHLNRNGKYRIYEMKVVGFVEGKDAVKLGWDTNSATRPAMLQQLKEAIDNRLLKIYDKKTVDELFSFVTVQTSSSWKATAEPGMHDDLVMSLAIAWQLYQTENSQQGYINQQQRDIIQQMLVKGESWR